MTLQAQNARPGVRLPRNGKMVSSSPRGPIYIRLPPDKPGAVCSWTGLTRGKLNALVLPSFYPDGRPPVESICIPNAYKNKKGCRLIVLESLLSYLERLRRKQNP